MKIAIIGYVIERMALNEKLKTQQRGTTMKKINVKKLVIVDDEIILLARKYGLFGQYLREKKTFIFRKGMNGPVTFKFTMSNHHETLVDGWIPTCSFDRKEFETKFYAAMK